MIKKLISINMKIKSDLNEIRLKQKKRDKKINKIK